MLLLSLRDGTVIGITDHNQDIDFNLAAAGLGEITYGSATGILTSNVVLSCGMESDNYEVDGPIGDVVTREAILGERFNRGVAWLFEVNWNSLGDGAIPILKGRVSEAKVKGGKFVFGVRSDIDFFNQPVGRLITNQCDADFADGIRCHATPTEITGTITAVTDAMRFTVSFSGSYANDFFNKGTVLALTGDNAGTLPVEIYDWTSGGTITLFAPLAEAPAIGDTFTVRNGCGKSRADCMAHDNILEFRGYPELPGSDQVLRMPIPGQGDQ